MVTDMQLLQLDPDFPFKKLGLLNSLGYYMLKEYFKNSKGKKFNNDIKEIIKTLKKQKFIDENTTGMKKALK